MLIDCAPLGAAIDAAVIAKECDGAVVVISQGDVSSKAAAAVKKQLDASGVKILGAVLNKVDMKKSRYYGKYYGNGEENLNAPKRPAPKVVAADLEPDEDDLDELNYLAGVTRKD